MPTNASIGKICHRCVPAPVLTLRHLELAKRMTDGISEKDKYVVSHSDRTFEQVLTLSAPRDLIVRLETRHRQLSQIANHFFPQDGLKAAGFNWYSGIKGTGTVLRKPFVLPWRRWALLTRIHTQVGWERGGGFVSSPVPFRPLRDSYQAFDYSTTTLEPAVQSSMGASRSSRAPSPSESFAQRSSSVDRLVSQVCRRPGHLRGRKVGQVRPRHPCDWVHGGQGVAHRDPRSGRRIPSQARLGPRQGGRAQRRLERHGHRWPVGHGGHLWMGAFPLQGRREPDQGQP